MIIAVALPRFSLHIALLTHRIPVDALAALAPRPDAPQHVGACTPQAAAHGVRAGLRVAEAIARCPGLLLLPPDPDATAAAHERLLVRLEHLGAAVASDTPGEACFVADGLLRLHGGYEVLIRRVHAVLPVGAMGRIGVAPTRFVAQQAAHHAPTQLPYVVTRDEMAAFLAPLSMHALPISAPRAQGFWDVGIRTIGAVAALTRAAALEHLGRNELRAWHIARGEDDEPLLPRTPPQPLRVHVRFDEPVDTLATIEIAARILLEELARTARTRGTSLRGLILRARLIGHSSWMREIALRDATTDVARLTLATLPLLTHISAPIEELAIDADASGGQIAQQLSLASLARDERTRRTHEVVAHIRAAMGDGAVMRAIPLETWSDLPERQWALIPYSSSPSHTSRE